MGLISINIPQAGQPNSTEDPKIASALTSIAATINGGIDDANVTDAALTDGSLASPNNSVWRPVTRAQADFGNGLAANSYAARLDGSVEVLPPQVPLVLSLPAAADVAVGGKTAKLRLRGHVMVNGTSPGLAGNLSVWLAPITSASGASAVFANTGATILAAALSINSANSILPFVSSDANWPASAGLYLFGFTTPSVISAPNNYQRIVYSLEMRHA